jgi:hypothetical protein
MKYFTRELMDRGQCGRHDWMRQSKAYRAELRAHEPKLPQSVRTFYRKVELHDAVLTGVVYRPDPNGANELELELGGYRVTFLGVRRQAGWSEALDQAWLYDELYSAEGGRFKLLVLFSETECEIVAANVRCFSEGFQKYVVEPEPVISTQEERKRAAKLIRDKGKRWNH